MASRTSASLSPQAPLSRHLRSSLRLSRWSGQSSPRLPRLIEPAFHLEVEFDAESGELVGMERVRIDAMRRREEAP
ncbi:hypothetical protein IOC61_04955 [Halomonas sp. KAO]|uniref:hypothetical protein n=1 Tax=Halomonas sp. KAO TaxID=2783858 RepID=UPI00189E7165|nr:hypothetical protein [Halomonas sp. KAO]MBF7052665.1 hypothetical protein [Halomonas sp. KAO]